MQLLSETFSDITWKTIQLKLSDGTRPVEYLHKNKVQTGSISQKNISVDSLTYYSDSVTTFQLPISLFLELFRILIN